MLIQNSMTYFDPFMHLSAGNDLFVSNYGHWKIIHYSVMMSLCRGPFALGIYMRFENQPGLEVIKLEFILRLKMKRNDWLLADTSSQSFAHHCRKQPIIALYFESETESQGPVLNSLHTSVVC